MNKTLTTLVHLLIFNFCFSQIPTTGLIGRWEFNGNANDGSPSANHGTVNSATLTTDRCGNANSAYLFNGTSDYIHMPMAGPSGAAPRSVSFWAKTNKSTLSFNDIMAVFGYGELANAKGWSIHYNYNCMGIGCDVHNEAYTCGAACLTDNNWHHIAVIFDTNLSASYGTMVYYVDGVQLPAISCVITGSTQTVNTGTVLPIEIGKVHDDMARYFQGSLDDFYLYDRPITSSEVQQLYYACLPSISGTSLICMASPTGYTYSVPPMPGATSYTWNFSSLITGTSNTNTITVYPTNVLGTLTLQVLANSTCGGLNQISAPFFIRTSHCTDLPQNTKLANVKVYPNPSSTGEYNVSIESNASIKVYNVLGDLVFSGYLNQGNNIIDLKRYGKGLYVARIENEKAGADFKLVIE